MNDNLGMLLPNIRVRPPGPKSLEAAGILKEYETPSLSGVTVGETPICWKQAKGANVIDEDDNLYIDVTAGWCVAISGYCNDGVVEAIKKQAELMTHAPGAMSNNMPRVLLEKRLGDMLPTKLKKSHIPNTGAEAIEVALKLSRVYTKQQNIIGFEGGFHGKTLGALSITSVRHYRENVLPLVQDVRHVPYAYCYRCAFGKNYPECGLQCLEYLRHVVTDPASGVSNIAAIVMECIIGHGGWIVPPDEFLPGVRKICDENNLLLILDEIITGFGRTGKMFCFEHYGVVPDILVTAKGIASGFPISATIASDEIMHAWEPFKHTSTFAANPIGCAAALANIDFVLKNKLPERSARIGQKFKSRLDEMKEKYEIVGDVRGKGSMVGIEVVKDKKSKTPAYKETKAIVKNALERGIIMQPPGGIYQNVLKISPPLVITDEQLDYAIDIIDESIRKASA
jgi:4-aminobutyrate aminotransferase/(S)-3-amino-2-methylpropionate transaminase